MQALSQEQGSPRGNDPWGEAMLAPDEVAAMVRLHGFGLGDKADCRGVGLQPEYGEALLVGGRLDGDSAAAPAAASGRA